MANRGETKTQKSLSAPNARYFLRKKDKFTTTSRPGPHNKETSVPLTFALTQLLKVAGIAREAKAILSEGQVKVNGIVRKSMRFTVGLFDIIEIESMKKKWRFTFDSKGRLVAKEIDYKSKDFKISKIVGKRKIKKGKVVLTTNDGFILEVGKESVNVGDSVRIGLPSRKIEEVLRLEKGNSVFIVAGTHVGETRKIDSIIEGNMQREKLISLGKESQKYQTVANNVFVVGKSKPELEVLTE